MPDCECREVVLSFLHLVVGPDGKRTVKEPVPAAGYDYKRGTIRPERQPMAGEPSLEALVAAVRAAHPFFCKDVELRHGQLKVLYVRALARAEQEDDTPGTPYARAEPKIGRNDPCPCGSGKKYKKCCGKADGAT